MTKYIKRRGNIYNFYCFEHNAETDADCTVRYFDNMFTSRCRKEKIKFSGYGEYKFYRNAYKDTLRDATKEYEQHDFLCKMNF